LPSQALPGGGIWERYPVRDWETQPVKFTNGVGRNRQHVPEGHPDDALHYERVPAQPHPLTVPGCQDHREGPEPCQRPSSWAAQRCRRWRGTPRRPARRHTPGPCWRCDPSCVRDEPHMAGQASEVPPVRRYYAHHIAHKPAFILLLGLGDLGKGQVGDAHPLITFLMLAPV
jgi:hypothetical protein